MTTAASSRAASKRAGARAGAARLTEADLTARWRAGEVAGRWLRTVAGEPLRVVFAGRPGGPAGPDFRDAVLARADGARVCGDVELHLRAAGWRAHGHATDHRYDRVVLHVVVRADGARATPLASGAWAPVVELGALELVEAPGLAAAGAVAGAAPSWPCQPQKMPGGTRPLALRGILLAAGEERFAGRVAAFRARLRDAARGPGGHWRAEDRVLLAALAEGLAYGRDRAALSAAGEWLAAGGAPDALTREVPRLPRLDAARLEGLLALVERWGAAGPWAALRHAIDPPGTGAAQGSAGAPGWERRGASAAVRDAVALGERLAATLVVPGGESGVLSPGRALILLANVVLPCGVAVAECAGDAALAARLWSTYRALPPAPARSRGCTTSGRGTAARSAATPAPAPSGPRSQPSRPILPYTAPMVKTPDDNPEAAMDETHDALTTSGERLHKLLAHAGVASRRHAEALMAAGRVTVNGAVVRQPGARVDPARDDVRVDGRPVQAPRAQTYVLLNKPRGPVTTASDPQGRATVLDLLPADLRARRLYPVGRLDRDTEGLLLLTDDGALALRLTHPRYALPKEYRALVRGRPTAAALERLRRGILLAGDARPTAPARVWIERMEGADAWVGLELHEGRNRQVRRMLEAVEHPVRALRRVRVGPLTLGALRPGEWRLLAPGEVAALREATGGER